MHRHGQQGQQGRQHVHIGHVGHAFHMCYKFMFSKNKENLKLFLV